MKTDQIGEAQQKRTVLQNRYFTIHNFTMIKWYIEIAGTLWFCVLDYGDEKSITKLQRLGTLL